MSSMDDIALRAVRRTQSPQLKVSVLTDIEKMRLEKERDSIELNGSGGGLGLGAFLEEVRDAHVVKQQRRAAVRNSKHNHRSPEAVARARAEKAKKKKQRR